MSNDESYISGKTWTRSESAIIKIGYMDGASDGQTVAFQTSFNTGYNQGLIFGLQLGFDKALIGTNGITTHEENLRDPRKINCLVCVNKNTEGKIYNLFNEQEENFRKDVVFKQM